jgi:hypothetical protein
MERDILTRDVAVEGQGSPAQPRMRPRLEVQASETVGMPKHGSESEKTALVAYAMLNKRMLWPVTFTTPLPSVDLSITTNYLYVPSSDNTLGCYRECSGERAPRWTSARP